MIGEIGDLFMRGGFDISQALGPGIYALFNRGRCVYVGFARCVISRVAEHRRLARTKQADWFPVKGIIFDKVEVYATHPDRLDDDLARLTAELRPIRGERNVESAAAS